jgi:hypothetical protein
MDLNGTKNTIYISVLSMSYRADVTSPSLFANSTRNDDGPVGIESAGSFDAFSVVLLALD